MAFKLPKFDRSIALVKANFTPTISFHQWWDAVVKALIKAINDIEANIVAIEEALAAADIAIAAAADAQAAADSAQAAADTAQDAADNATGLTSVVNSGVDINPLTAVDAGSDASIIVANHNRLYPDGSSVAVTGATITALLYSTEYWVFYDDPTRAGGAVTYLVSTVEADAAQAGDRHLVGKITTPAALDPDTTGLYKKYPGLEVV